MPKQKNYFNLTNREMDILNILWEAGEALTASEIVKNDESLTINTVQAVLRKLMKKKLIRVSNIVYSGTVLCRSYIPTITSDEFALQQFSCEFKKMNKNITTSNLVAALLTPEGENKTPLEEIEKLEGILKNYKEDNF